MKATKQYLTARYIFAITKSLEAAQFHWMRQAGTLRDELHLPTYDTNVQKLLIMPWASEIRWPQRPAVKVTYTTGGTVVERAGMRYREVTLSGDVGPIPNRWPDGTEEDIAESVRAIEELAQWIAQVAADPSLVLQLYAINEGQNWIAIPTDGVNLTRSRSNRTGYHYDVSLRLLAPAQKPTIDMHYWFLPSASGWPKNPLKAILKAVNIAKAFVQKAIDAVNAVKAWIDKNILGPINQIVEALFEIAEGLVELAAELEQWAADIVHKPQQWWGRMKRLGRKAEGLGRDCKRDFYEYFKKGGNFEPYKVKAGERIEPTSAVSGAIEAVDAAADATLVAMQEMAVAFNSERAAFAFQPVPPNETIDAMAIRLYGTPDGVAEIARLNNLIYPYFSAVEQPGCVRPGQKIIVPAPAPANTGVTIASPEVTDPDELLLGSDFAFVDGDLVWTPGAFDLGEQADLEMVTGVECFETNLQARMSTTKGTNLLFPNTGLPPELGRGATRDRQAAFATQSMAEYKADDRVASVTDFSVSTVGNKLAAEATLNLRSGAQVTAGG